MTPMETNLDREIVLSVPKKYNTQFGYRVCLIENPKLFRDYVRLKNGVWKSVFGPWIEKGHNTRRSWEFTLPNGEIDQDSVLLEYIKVFESPFELKKLDHPVYLVIGRRGIRGRAFPQKEEVN